MGMSRLIFLFTVAFHRMKTAKKIYQNGKKWSYLKKITNTKKIYQTNKFVKANTRYIQCFFVFLNLVNVICRFVSAKKTQRRFSMPGHSFPFAQFQNMNVLSLWMVWPLNTKYHATTWHEQLFVLLNAKKSKKRFCRSAREAWLFREE